MQSNDRRARAIGGVFFRSKDAEATKNWYARHLGLVTNDYGSIFAWRHDTAPEQRGFTVWGAFADDTDYFGAQDQQFMVNYRVDNLESLVASLKTEGVEIVSEIMNEPQGKFVHIIDLDGRRVELWEPDDEACERESEGVTN